MDNSDTDREMALYIQEVTDVAEVSVSSLSGGKTSSFMALRYPTDYYIFSIVLTRDPHCRITDKGLLRDIRAKCPLFEGSRELNQTLINLLSLEQDLGKEIIWVWGDTFEDLIRQKQALPNFRSRFCTTQLKILPVFWWCYQNILNPELDDNGNLKQVTPCTMNIGFRADESNRVYKTLGAIKNESSWDWSNVGGCEEASNISLKCDITGKYRNKHRRLSTLEWRFKQFPLWKEGFTKPVIDQYWELRKWSFPEVSNCDFCFHHTPEQQFKQYQQNPTRLYWWNNLEKETGYTFGNKNVISAIYEGANKKSKKKSNNLDTCGCTD